MKLHPLYPLLFHPLYRTTPWGGDGIAAHYNRANTPALCGESWELSAVPGMDSVVTNGPLEGHTLSELTAAFGPELTGTRAPDPERFPLLIKLLDVRENLSVQVHPDSAAAEQLDALPKHELWYVLKSAPGSCVWAGQTAPGPISAIRERLMQHAVSPGDVIDIPPGTVHAVGAGNLIFEVQQASVDGYRIDDWGRDRKLHLDSAAHAIRETTVLHQPEPPSPREIFPRYTSPDFTLATLTFNRQRSLHTGAHTFLTLFCETGKVTLSHAGPMPLTLLPGDLVLIPPKQEITLRALSPARLLMTGL